MQELLEQYNYDTMVCSLQGPMRKVTMYAPIVAAGTDALTPVLRFLVDHPGMSTQLLLSDIVGEDIWSGEEVEGGFRAINVYDSANLWLQWGHKHGHLTDDDPWTVAAEQ